MSAANSSSNNSNKYHARYAEIVNREGLTLPIKVLLNQTLTSTAIDSLRDSKEVANQLAKSWLIGFLGDKNNATKFGYVLQDLFAYEPVLSPTRWLVYWTIAHEPTKALAVSQLKWNLHNNIVGDTSPAAKELVLATKRLLQNKSFIDHQTIPLLKWTLQENKAVISNTIDLVASSIPFAKDSTAEGLKYLVTESLKSSEAKKLVKETLIEYVKKINSDFEQKK